MADLITFYLSMTFFSLFPVVHPPPNPSRAPFSSPVLAWALPASSSLIRSLMWLP